MGGGVIYRAELRAVSFVSGDTDVRSDHTAP